MDNSKPFDEWAIVEVMGHNKYAGHVTEQTIGSSAFARVDVPAVAPDEDSFVGESALPAFTKILGPGSIFAITPCTMETAIAFARKLRCRAFPLYEATCAAPVRQPRIGQSAAAPWEDDFTDSEKEL